MAATKICKICGNEYEYCHTFRRDTIFRWQDVACCVEHGNEYFARIAASRGDAPASKPVEVESVDAEALPQIEDEEVKDIEETQVDEFPIISKSKKTRK